MPTYYGDFVTPVALCTGADVAAYTGIAAPVNVTALIRSATRLVLRETRQAYYNVDPLTGLATDTQTQGAMRDATVIQVVAWAAIGYDPLTGGVITPKVKSSSKLGSAAFTFADATLSAEARADALKHLVPEAEQLLELQNLLIPNPWTYG